MRASTISFEEGRGGKDKRKNGRGEKRIDHECGLALQRAIEAKWRDDLRLVIGERSSRGTDGTKSDNGSDILRGRD